MQHVKFIAHDGGLFEINPSKELYEALYPVLPAAEYSNTAGKLEHLGHSIPVDTSSVSINGNKRSENDIRINSIRLHRAVFSSCIRPYKHRGRLVPKDIENRLNKDDFDRLLAFMVTGDRSNLKPAAKEKGETENDKMD